MGKEAYAEYRRSSTWAKKRKAALDRADHACQLCNRTKSLEVHHRTYERIGGDELPGDLTVLCRPCHKKFHGKDGSEPRYVKTQKKAKKPRASQGEVLVALRARINGLPPGCRFSTGQMVNGLSPYSRSVIGSCLRYLADRGEIEQESKRRWRRPRVPKVAAPLKKPRPATREDIEALARQLGSEAQRSHEPGSKTPATERGRPRAQAT